MLKRNQAGRIVESINKFFHRSKAKRKNVSAGIVGWRIASVNFQRRKKKKKKKEELAS